MREIWWVRGVVFAAALLLIVGMGCCLFDDHDAAGHVVPPGLCLGMLAVSLGVMSLAPLPAIGWAVSLLVVVAYAVARHTPDPPPRPVLSS